MSRQAIAVWIMWIMWYSMSSRDLRTSTLVSVRKDRKKRGRFAERLTATSKGCTRHNIKVMRALRAVDGCRGRR